jgi:hypothetical protein
MAHLISCDKPLARQTNECRRSSVFERMGGFADIPLMEDLEFSRRLLRRLGGVVLLDPPLWSSPQRFRRQGNWRTKLLSMAFIGLFYLGVDPGILHRWYYGRLRGSSVHGVGVNPGSRG